MRVAVIGSRNIDSDKIKQRAYALLCRYIPVNTTELVSGGAVGIDTLAELYAGRNGIPIKVFKPDYARYGKRAPLVRNEEIIDYAQYVLAVWDGSSHGTAYTVSVCLQKGVPVKIISLDEEISVEDEDFL